MFNGRKRLITALSAIALAATVGFVPGTAQAEPDIDDVEARVDKLYHQAEVSQERYNDAKLELKELRGDLDSLKADQARQDQRLQTVRTQVQDSIVRQYQGDNMSAMGQIVVSRDPGAFLRQLSTMSSFNDIQSQLFDNYARELKALDIRRDATRKQLAQAAELEDELAREKATVDKKVEEAESLLDRLEAEQREAMTSRGTVTRTPTVSASGRAGAAVSYAMAQVGDAYVYGGTGPDGFDCSGLTMMAWAQAGVSLPHSSSAQYSSGPQVPASALQPGDLVFYYSPISHVGMYIGGGQIVHAANPSTDVQVTGLYSMPFSGAVRPG